MIFIYTCPVVFYFNLFYSIHILILSKFHKKINYLKALLLYTTHSLILRYFPQPRYKPNFLLNPRHSIKFLQLIRYLLIMLR